VQLEDAEFWVDEPFEVAADQADLMASQIRSNSVLTSVSSRTMATARDALPSRLTTVRRSAAKARLCISWSSSG
jgi:hypothetical protein